MHNLPLLPSDRYIADLLGLTEEQYRYFIAEVRRRAAAGPQPSVTAEISTATLATIALVSSLISIGLAVAAMFFKPGQLDPTTMSQTQVEGQTITSNRRYAPRSGFDSIQDVATIGSSIPLVYAKREIIDGQFYGGVRVNMPLIWSNIITADKTQLLRALFLIGEGDDLYQIDPFNTAIGNNSLGAYLLGNTSTARFSIYYRSNGGRITADDLVAGTASDPAMASPSDVFAISDALGNLNTDFSHVYKPSTQTQFGVYGLIGNGLGLRVNPSLRPGVQAQLTADDGGGKKSDPKARVVCDIDVAAMGQRKKYQASFSGRSCITSTTGTTWQYLLSKTTDALTTFNYQDDVTWTGVQNLSVNPFADIPDNIVQSWVSYTGITAGDGSVTGTIVFDTTQATSTINSKVNGLYVHDVSNGQYQIVYYATFQSSSGKRPSAEHTVTVVVTNNLNSRSCDYQNTTATYTKQYTENSEYEEKCGDVASSVAGRQKTWDDAILVGELYKLGSAIGICTSRTPTDIYFNSDSDFEPVEPSQGNSVIAEFEIVRPGIATAISQAEIETNAGGEIPPPCYTATNFPHIYRLAVANFSTLRECKVVSIGIRSSLGIRIGGLCNFRDSLTLTEIDGKACKDKEGDELGAGDSLSVDVFTSGVMNSSEERYSFFRISYREAGKDGEFTELPQCFGIRGMTQQSIYNSITFAMPAEKRWDFRFEPLSGWEIRSGTALGDLELIDSSVLTTRTISSGGVTVSFRGIANNDGPFIVAGERSIEGPEKFQITSVQRGALPEIGIGYSDSYGTYNSYLDTWGKLAEAFIYEEAKSSADGGPEHEIVYVNEFSPNAKTPEYTNLALLGLSMRAGTEWQQLGQLSAYVLAGLRNTHLFPEVLADIITNKRYGSGDQITNQQINYESFEEAKNWCYNRRLFFDGVIATKINIRQWGADVAAAHLLFFGEGNGKFWLKPAWPGSVEMPSKVQVKGIFTAGNMVGGSFSMEFFEPLQREPIQVSVRYREERLSVNFDNPGLFPTEREIVVREAAPYSTPASPVESLDLSDYVTSRRHAIDAAKFVARMRRVPDHVVKFSTTHEGIVAALAPGDYIKVVLDIMNYSELRNGAVLGDGSLVSTQSLEDGRYPVLAWNGSSTTPPSETTMVVSGGGKTATPTGVIFTLINAEVQSRNYQIEKISPSEDGSFSIEAIHMPVNSEGILEIADGFTDDENWIIEG